MKPLELPQAAIFDLDGTLFRTETLLAYAYEATFERLRKEGLYAGDTPPVERIYESLGMLLEQIWRKVMPDTPEHVHRRADDYLLEYELEGLRAGKGVLYDGVEETLRALKARGVRLFVASNGLEAYVKEVVQRKGLAPLFDGVYSAGEYATSSKVDLVRLLLQTYKLDKGKAWMVGDRSSDVEAGMKNGLTVIGCDYAGFRKPGELDGADAVIGTFTELLDLI